MSDMQLQEPAANARECGKLRRLSLAIDFYWNVDILKRRPRAEHELSHGRVCDIGPVAQAWVIIFKIKGDFRYTKKVYIFGLEQIESFAEGGRIPLSIYPACSNRNGVGKVWAGIWDEGKRNDAKVREERQPKKRLDAFRAPKRCSNPRNTKNDKSREGCQE